VGQERWNNPWLRFQKLTRPILVEMEHFVEAVAVMNGGQPTVIREDKTNGGHGIVEEIWIIFL